MMMNDLRSGYEPGLELSENMMELLVLQELEYYMRNGLAAVFERILVKVLLVGVMISIFVILRRFGGIRWSSSNPRSMA